MARTPPEFTADPQAPRPHQVSRESLSSSPHALLASLVARCRELREFVDEVASSVASEEGDAFLQGQLEEVLEELDESLERLRDPETSGPIRHSSSSERAPALEGSAWTIPLDEFIGFLASHRKTGVLWVTSPDELFLVEFKDGKLSRASSDCAPVGQRLGDLLVAQGALEEARVVELVGEARRNFKHFGTYLVECGEVSESQVRTALMAQVQSLFYRLMRARNAVYRFQEGSELTDAHELDINVTGLLLEGARRIDESEHELELDALLAESLAEAGAPGLRGRDDDSPEGERPESPAA